MSVTIKPGAKCPCHSGKSYRECCQLVHRDPRAARAPEAMMRSRYSGFALGLVDHLVATIHPTHRDAAVGAIALRASIAESARNHKYTGLTVLEASEEGDRATVTFHARVFARGKDVSFDERSTFLREDGVWLYAVGEELS